MIESIENLGIHCVENCEIESYSVEEWVSHKRSGTEIYNQIKNILRTAVDDKGRSFYGEKIRQMCENNRQSFEVDFNVLASSSKGEVLAFYLSEAPIEILKKFDEAAKDVVLSMYPQYEETASEIHVRITGFPPFEDIRGLRQFHLNTLIRTAGIVTGVATGVLPQLSLVKYDCSKCNYVLGPYVMSYDSEIKPGTCPECQSKEPFQNGVEQAVYKNYQRLTIQESPVEVKAGSLPRSKDAILLGDLCDVCKPGDEVELTGVYSSTYDRSLNTANGFPVFATVIIANHIAKKKMK